LALAAHLSPRELCRQAHGDFSPIGWHLGHIAFTEALWIEEHLQGQRVLTAEQRRLFAADGLPKAEREHLPPREELVAFLQQVRDRTLAYLDQAPLGETLAHLRLWRWLLQHECQHLETATLLLTLHRWPQAPTGYPTQPLPPEAPIGQTLTLPGGAGTLGCDRPHALDNERPPHPITVAPFALEATPVTVAAYRRFIAAGGYRDPQWWTPEGWAWVQANAITQPQYWRERVDDRAAADPEGDRHPVCGVSWYEADAYARFVGQRLPTEAEWEWAARHTPLTLGVWEWTETWFQGYPGFDAYPYRGYSAVYFDGQHRVLRGASSATLPWAQRPSFRNWYHPHVRVIFAGFRCARSLPAEVAASPEGTI
jgi:ergothioneine biosynthesis protein EgtB